ncbi:ATP-dependent sacrificial sulfur transferase LarE [Zongyangia hominis]|uniref:ATP-dependent sacrificial sulfur transferase LarE n=1 Tax=Zongyangia hominis TaxID=2763677 RepID=A0A926E959_9FIRM|nr:ATP-dependent sacrificial sulfur transferase LarE [Zongyangia hominis]MBC8569503.1 ATP-dependent sacrificial sulfur transferase LarE [Zongyangia hominis]
MNHPLEQRLAQLGKDGLCIAFSGGVDSALLVGIAARLPVRVHAVTFSTRLHPQADIDAARAFAKERGITHAVLEIDELEDERILMNPPERCYLCKSLLFRKLKSYAQREGLGAVIDGTNADDLTEYRPGLKALQELSILSPLAELHIGKGEVRRLARVMGLEVAEKPSSPCLATRLPYGTPITMEALHRIEAGEALLREMGFAQCRLRLHGEIARIEIPLTDFPAFLKRREEIVESLRGLGIGYVTLDMEGFRSGSMDIRLNRRKRNGHDGTSASGQRGPDEYRRSGRSS